MPEDDPVVFGQVLCWIYGRFDDVLNADTTMESALDFMVLTDKLLIQPCPAQQIADQYVAKFIINDNGLSAENIRRAYSILSGNPIAKVFAEHATLSYVQSMSNWQEFIFERELKEVPGFAIDLLASVRQASRMGKTECRNVNGKRTKCHKTYQYYWNPATQAQSLVTENKDEDEK